MFISGAAENLVKRAEGTSRAACRHGILGGVRGMLPGKFCILLSKWCVFLQSKTEIIKFTKVPPSGVFKHVKFIGVGNNSEVGGGEERRRYVSAKGAHSLGGG